MHNRTLVVVGGLGLLAWWYAREKDRMKSAPPSAPPPIPAHDTGAMSFGGTTGQWEAWQEIEVTAVVPDDSFAQGTRQIGCWRTYGYLAEWMKSGLYYYYPGSIVNVYPSSGTCPRWFTGAFF